MGNATRICSVTVSKRFGERVATIDGGDDNSHHANARLIAAAPALLAALQNICMKYADGSLEFIQAAQVITQATGAVLP